MSNTSLMWLLKNLHLNLQPGDTWFGFFMLNIHMEHFYFKMSKTDYFYYTFC